jgi:hypothetical protein
MAEDKRVGVIVLVVDPDANTVIRRHTVDYNKSKNRAWLHNMYVWAFNNDYIVEIFSGKVDKKHKLSDDYYLTEAKARPK